jgi:hypothetical protein
MKFERNSISYGILVNLGLPILFNKNKIKSVIFLIIGHGVKKNSIGLYTVSNNSCLNHVHLVTTPSSMDLNKLGTNALVTPTKNI